jgi:integrase
MAMLTEIGLKARIKKTKKKLEKANIRDSSFAIEGGLSMRVFQNGRACFQYRYSRPGKEGKSRFVYGDYPSISLEKARELHSEAKKQVRAGVDINSEKALETQKRIAEPTIQEMFDRYQVDYLATLKRPKQTIYYFDKDVLPEIGQMKVSDVKRANLTNLLMKVVRRGAPVGANKLLSMLKIFFRYCVESGTIEHNPADLISKKFIGGTEKPVERALSIDEVRKFWTTIDAGPFSRQVILVLKLLLLTGARVGEVCNAEWKEIDLNSHIWTIPAEKNKTATEHRVSLHDMAMNCIDELKTLSGNSRFVVQSPYQGKGEVPLNVNSVSFALRAHADYFGFKEPFTAHDLRRTAATLMNEIGIQPFIVEKLLNHKLRGMQAVYNRAEYWPERVEALKRWEEKIKQIAAGKKVIQLKTKEA